MNRRGLIAFMGAGSALLPFVGKAVALEVDKAGRMTVAEPRPTFEPIPIVDHAGDYLIVPARNIRSVEAHYRASSIDVTSFDSYQTEVVIPQMSEITMRVSVDAAFAQHAFAVFSRATR